MEQDVMSPEAAEQVVPSIIVVIADTNACLPTRTSESRLFCNIGKCAVAFVLVKVRDRFLSSGPMRAEPISIRKVDVEPAVIIVIKEGQTASLGLNDDSLVIDAAPHVGDIQPSFFSHIEILNRGRTEP